MPTDSEIGQKETKGAQTERRILDAAEALFAERGFEAASLREIARAAEASGKEHNVAVESKKYTPQQLGSPHIQIVKGVISKLAEADFGTAKQITMAQDVMYLLNVALGELPRSRGN